MSRTGKNPIFIPQGVIVDLKDKYIMVTGPLGRLSQNIYGNIYLEILNEKLFVHRTTNKKKDRSLHGLYRSLIYNMIIGVNKGFIKKLELIGIGYRVLHKDQILELNLGFSHNIIMQCPPEIKIEVKVEKGKNSLIFLKSFDKQLLGLIAAKIRSFRKPEPYKGKGIRYLGENIRRKDGKSA